MNRLQLVTSAEQKPFLQALNKEPVVRIPFWFMRQAGRYLPEYRDLRVAKEGFLALVMDPQAACEVTMQPLRRFDMDAAILFSDILVVPLALGQKLEFAPGEGPKLEPIRTEAQIEKLDYERFKNRLEPIYETVFRVRSVLTAENFTSTALIGFAGAPWTVAAYMIEGSGSKDFPQARRMAESDPHFAKLINIVTEVTIDYLSRQAEAGAEALQLFDSWAGLLAGDQFQRWVIAPTQKITTALRHAYPQIPLIGFPRGASQKNYELYAAVAGVDALGLDQHVNLDHAKVLQDTLPVQGNLDPAHLLAGGKILEENALRILEALSGGPFVFNLGHGIDKNTPVEHVETMVKIVKDFRP